MTFTKRPDAPKMSKTKALQEMCKACIYDKACPGTWREQVEACESKHCPIWQHRPMTVATVNANRKVRGEVNGIDIDALVAGLDDEEDAIENEADQVA